MQYVYIWRQTFLTSDSLKKKLSFPGECWIFFITSELHRRLTFFLFFPSFSFFFSFIIQGGPIKNKQNSNYRHFKRLLFCFFEFSAFPLHQPRVIGLKHEGNWTCISEDISILGNLVENRVCEIYLINRCYTNIIQN